MTHAPPSRPPGKPLNRPGRSRLSAWLELLRVGNLLTVPGDPIAGFLLAAAWGLGASRPGLRLALAASVSLMLYAAGLLWNDWFDLAEDRRERPGRPLPRQAVRPGIVAVVANVLIALAVATAAVAGTTTLYVALALGAAILAYDAGAKRIPVVGPITMGLCRTASVLLGAAAFGKAGLIAPPVIACAAGAGAYIAAVTVLAAGETRPTRVRGKCLLVTGALGTWCVALVWTVPPASATARWALTATCAAAAVYLVARMARLGASPGAADVQQTIGTLIRGLVLLQAAAVISTGPVGAGVAAGLGGAFVLSTLLGRRFAAS